MILQSADQRVQTTARQEEFDDDDDDVGRHRQGARQNAGAEVQQLFTHSSPTADEPPVKTTTHSFFAMRDTPLANCIFADLSGIGGAKIHAELEFANTPK